MTPTIKNLALHIGKTPQSIYHIKKTNKNLFQLIWNGWLEYCKDKK